jgi:hypothetical protein
MNKSLNMRAKFIYEKFTEDDSDPISDLNIGYAFLHKLKKGTMFIAKKQMGFSSSNLDEYILVENGPYTMRKGWCGIITAVDLNEEKLQLKIKCAGFDDITAAKKSRDVINRSISPSEQITIQFKYDEWKPNFEIAEE